jgi:hypothetical protein
MCLKQVLKMSSPEHLFLHISRMCDVVITIFGMQQDITFVLYANATWSRFTWFYKSYGN